MDGPAPDSSEGDGTSEHGDGDPAFAEVMRSKSAGWLLLAEKFHPKMERNCDRLDELGFDSSSIRALQSNLRQQALLLHSLHAAQARAYDDMLTAGGPNDPTAYEQYELATDFNLALLARPGDSADSGDEDEPRADS